MDLFDARTKNLLKSKVIIGMSGGVDSSVAAHLLQEQGYQVEGLFMKNWEEERDDGYCPAAKDLLDAQAVCQKLDIKLHTVNFAEEYWHSVFDDFLSALKQGFTPNPDVLCNKEIKFKVFLEHAKTLGADLIATGHYCRRVDENNHTYLYKGLDNNKDQSYFLNQLSEQQLSQALFPIGDHLKPQIRELAKQLKLRTHNKKDSTGICFIGERKFKQFLQEYLPAQAGNIITEDGTVVGQHDGLMYYTIGQRQGLNIGGMKEGSGEPWYVADKILSSNELLVVQGKNHPLLFQQQLLVTKLHLIQPIDLTSHQLKCKTRYRQADQSCKIEKINDREHRVIFEQAQRAITPGQYLVLYNGEQCLGGGIIAPKEG